MKVKVTLTGGISVSDNFSLFDTIHQLVNELFQKPRLVDNYTDIACGSLWNPELQILHDRYHFIFAREQYKNTSLLPW